MDPVNARSRGKKQEYKRLYWSWSNENWSTKNSISQLDSKEHPVNNAFFSNKAILYGVSKDPKKRPNKKTKKKKKKRAVWSLTTYHIRNRVFVTNSQANDWVHCWVNHPGRNPGDVRNNQNPNGNHGQTQMQSYYLRLTSWLCGVPRPPCPKLPRVTIPKRPVATLQKHRTQLREIQK